MYPLGHTEPSEESDLLWVAPRVARHLTRINNGNEFNTVRSLSLRCGDKPRCAGRDDNYRSRS